MSKRGRKRRDRRKHGANHGKRPYPLTGVLTGLGVRGSASAPTVLSPLDF